MLFAIDYDDTWNKDSELFKKISCLIEAHGHKVIVATMRFKEQNNKDMLENVGDKIPIVY